MKGSKLLESSKQFALDVIEVYKKLSTKEYILSKQFLRSGTSIGANIHEAYYAQSKNDFISKLKIVLKESYETEYWLEILNASNYLDNNYYKSLMSSCGIIRRMLVASCNTANNN